MSNIDFILFKLVKIGVTIEEGLSDNILCDKYPKLKTAIDKLAIVAEDAYQIAGEVAKEEADNAQQ